MLAKKGGYAVQRCYRMEARNPTELATLVHRAKARMRRDAEDRKRLGLPRLVPATASPRETSPSGTDAPNVDLICSHAKSKSKSPPFLE
jgi:hypothetical protein